MNCSFFDLGSSVITAKHRKPYNEMWAVLASMPNLRHLDITIWARKCPYPAPADLKEVWLGPLKQLGEMNVFNVQVPLSYCCRLSGDVRHDFRWFDFSLEAYMEPFSVDEGSNFTLRAVQDINSKTCVYKLRLW
jgi:hypothetical protein